MTDLVQLSDERLMLLYQQGQMEAFDVLYRRHSSKVYGYVRRKVRNAAEAGDIFQMVMMKVHSSRERYSESYPFLPWLFTVTRTVLIDAARKSQREGWMTRVDEIIAGEALALASNVSSTQSDEGLLGAVVGFEALSEQQRRAVELRYQDDRSFEEIASVLETSPANVRQLISRAVRQLRRLAGVKEGT